MQRLLEGEGDELDGSLAPLLGARNPFPSRRRPPVLMRASFFVLEPRPIVAALASGRYWSRRYIHQHLAPRRSNPAIWDHWLPSPHGFHPDAEFWRRAAPALEPLRRTEGGAAARRALLPTTLWATVIDPLLA